MFLTFELPLLVQRNEGISLNNLYMIKNYKINEKMPFELTLLISVLLAHQACV